VKVIKKTGHMQ